MATPPPFPSNPPAQPAFAKDKKSGRGCWIWGGGGCLVLLLGFFLLPAIVVPNYLRKREARKKALQKPIQVAMEKYEPLVGEGLMGSGFHFEWDGVRFIACSLHQFDGEAPKEMILADLEDKVPIRERVFISDDVQILRYESKKLDAIKPLVYKPDVELSEGHPVIIYHLDGYTTGHVSRVKSALDGLAHVELEARFDAQGCSGTPVVSGITGTVIGVATTARNPEAALDIGFERLQLPEKIKETK